MSSAGFSTIEALVAAALLSLLAGAVTSTLVLARRLQTSVAGERHATALAVSSMERLRAGDAPRSRRTPSGFDVDEHVAPWSGSPRLSSVQVRVTWEQGTRSVELVTLAFQ